MKVDRDILNNLCLNITDGEHGTIQNDNNGRYFLLSNKNIINGQIIISDADRRINKESFSKINKRTKLENGDLVISTVGVLGKLAIIKTENLNYDFQRSVGIVKCDEKKINTKYLYYYLNTQFVQNRLNHLSKGAVQKCLFISDLKNLEIDFPVLSTQQKIASVLSALDDKIELNNRINLELEAMAKTLYDYWFVQFDFPNIEGKPYKTSGGKMVYNKTLKREIPEGWEVKKLEEIEEKIVTGKTPSTKVSEYFNGNIPFITIDDIRKQFYVYNAERNLTILGAESQANKYVYSGDICVSCIGTIGIIGIVATTSQTNQQINTISQIKDYNRYFLLNSLKNYFEYNVGAKKGAVLDNMNKQEFSNIPILDANRNLKKLYFDKVNPIYEKIKLNLKQNQELSALRDWLLPMLMNGQVKVGEIVENKEAKIVELNKSQIVKPGDFKECFTDKDKKVCRKMLATFIINESLNDQSFGKTKFEKLLHLVEYHLVKGDFNQSYTVQAAGPYDGAFTKTFWSEVLKGEWFKIEELGSLKRIKAGKNHIKSLKDYGYFSESLKESVRGFVHKFSNSNYEQPEIISTLFAVWNNRIIRKEIITDELIKEDFLNWDLGKGKYANRLDKALDWMRKEGIIPNGWGKEIKRTKKNK